MKIYLKIIQFSGNYSRTFALFALLLILQLPVSAQCDVANFTVLSVAGDCANNNTVTVTIPGAVTCTNVQATLYQGATVVQGPNTLPANGIYTFTNVSIGSYTVQLTQGASTYGPQNVTVTSTYVPLTYTSTVTAPTCPPTANQYIANATVTVTIPANVGKAPFTYTLVSPTAGTLTSGSTSARTYIFTGLGNNETETLTVSDACGTAIIQNPQTGSNNTPLPTDLRVIFIRNCNTAACDVFDIVVQSLCAGIMADYAQFSTDGGATWTTMNLNASNLPPYRWTYSAGQTFFSGFTTSVQVQAGQTVIVKARTNCHELTETHVVPVANNSYLQTVPFSVRESCVPKYIIMISDEESIAGGNFRMSFCRGATTIEVQKETPAGSGTYVQESILYNQDLETSTALSGYTWTRATASLYKYALEVSSAGKYRVIVSDACHTITNTVTVNTLAPPNFALQWGGGVFANTRSVNFNHTTGPLSIIVNTVPAGQTKTFNSGPYNFENGNPYSITFPKTYSFNSPGYSSIWELPLGTYSFTVIDHTCGDTMTQTYTLPSVSSYDPVLTVTPGCLNSNIINLTMNPNSVTVDTHGPISLLYNNSGTPGANVPGVTINNPTSGTWGPGYGTITFSNVPTGNFFIKFSPLGVNYEPWYIHSLLDKNTIAQRSLYIPVEIPAIASMQFTLTQGACGATGYIGVTPQDPSLYVYPLTYELYAGTTATGSPLQTLTAANATEIVKVFNGLPINADYTVKVKDQCSEAVQTITLNGSSIPAELKTAPESPVCPGSQVELYVANIAEAAYDFEWKDGSGTTIGTTPRVYVIPPSGTNNYTVTFTLKPAICTGGTPETLSVTVTVLDVTAPGSIGSDQAFCSGLSPAPLTSIADGSGPGVLSYLWEKFATGDADWSVITGATSATYSPGILTSTTRYRRTTVSTNGTVFCNSVPTNEVLITIYTIPTISNTTPGSRCGEGTVTLSALSVTGTVNWYDSATGGTLLGTGNTFTTPSINTNTTYYVDATANGCTTATRTPVTATINSIPTITGTTPGSRCGAGTVILGATASDGTVNWYDTATGGTLLGTGTSFTTPNLSATTNYYVDATANGCTTTTRTAVIATINTIPTVNIASVNDVCLNQTPVSLYGTPTGGTFSGLGVTGNTFNPSTAGVGIHTVTYSYTNAQGCTASASTTIAVLDAATSLAIIPPTQSICSGQSASFAVTGNNGATVNWTANIMLPVATGTNYNTGILHNMGTSPYTTVLTATVQTGNCVAQTSATLTVLPEPRVNVVPNKAVVCFYEIPQFTLTSVIPGTTIDWQLVNNATSAVVTSGSGIDSVSLFGTSYPAGSYILKVSGTKDGCSSTVINIPLTVN